MAAAVMMRDPLTPDAPPRPRYVLECYNKERIDGKGLRDLNETDGYVLGCLARTLGSTLSWALGHMMHSKLSEFASYVWMARTLEAFDEVRRADVAVAAA